VVEGITALERLRPAEDGIDYGVCVPRDLQDVQLVEAAREQGADVREHCTVVSLRLRAGRVAGVRYRDGDGAERELASTLLVGADGRRSTVAALVGAWTPYRLSRNGRGLVFRYLEDPLAGGIEAQTYYQWREGNSFAFAFPTTPAGRLLILLMGHRDEVGEARSDPEGYWQRKLTEHPGLAQRLAGAATGTKLRSTGETPAFFRASSGPGWALAGDAGRFKDPVTGQGMRDAMFAGRTLAEQVLPLLDDPDAVDRATRAWEAARDRECLPAYHFANSDTRVERQSAVICELLRDAGRTTDPDVTDLFGRARTPQEIATLPRVTRALGAALWRGEQPRVQTLRRAVPELRRELAVRFELRAGRFRSTRTIAGSEHPGAEWPAAPKPPTTSAPTTSTTTTASTQPVGEEVVA
jgi:flavin-dependent dehydrogenase